MGAINSIDVFTEAQANISAGVREVFFLRMLGPVSGIEEKVKALDKSMEVEIQNGRLDYHRIISLPRLVMPEDISYYSSVYDKYKSDPASVVFKKWTVSTELQSVICAAVDNLISIFTKTKTSVTESIIKNFTVKIFHWLDVVGAEILTNWDESRSMKIIASDVIKEQEYLFFYLLTQLGCDVLLLEFERDVEAADTLKGLSVVVSTNPFRKVVIPEYKKYVPVHVGSSAAPTIGGSFTRDGSVSSRAVARDGEESINRSVSQGGGISLARPASYKGGSSAQERRELSYEQLAQLASSIVMIAVKDDSGEVDCTGSGIMVGTGGYILTNFHVVAEGRDYLVRIEDDDEVYYSDELVKYNQNLDLALIKIDKRLTPLPVYRGPQKLVRGQRVVAIGSPLGMFNTVSDGIISGFRNIRGEDMIQFTAPISSGSSGGAVLNMYGEIIGISTAGIDGGQNLNLAMGYESILDFAGRFLQ